METIRQWESGLNFSVVNGHGSEDVPASRRLALDAQAFFEFHLSRVGFFPNKGTGLRDVTFERDFHTLDAHGQDEFLPKRILDDSPKLLAAQRVIARRVIGDRCMGCHRFPGIYSFNSFHQGFPYGLQRPRVNGEDEELEDVSPQSVLIAPPTARVEEAALQ